MKRLDSLQGLRAVAFVAIFLDHCGLLGLSGMGVSIFFVMSGFLMVYNYFKSELPCGFVHNINFSIGKVKKLYPLHLLMILPMLLLTVYGVIKTQNGMVGITEAIPALLANVLLIQAWFPIRDIYFGFNGVAWYLSVSLFLYFVFPYVLKFMKKCWTREKAFFSIGLVFIMQVLLGMATETPVGEQVIGNVAWFTHIFPLYRSGDFLIGCSLGYLFLTRGFSNNNKERVKSSILEIVAIVIILCTYLLMKTGNIPKGIEQTAVYIPGVTLLIYTLAKYEGFISKGMGNKLFIEIGNMSAYMFLIHQVVINVVELFGIKNWLLPVIAIAITFLIAYCYKYIGQTRKISKES